MANKDGDKTKYTRCFKSPFRLLTKARDFYVRSMLACETRMEQRSVNGACAAFSFSSTHTSFNFDSSKYSPRNEDLMELVSAACAQNLENTAESEIIRPRRCMKLPTAGGWQGLQQRRRVGIGRIDEDGPCEYGEDVQVETEHNMNGRSRNFVVSKRAT